LQNTDTVLVLRCQEDDYDAFDEIVARYKDEIYTYIRRMISNRDDAEDLAQEVFVRAFASIKSFRRESNLRTWLYRIATNLCIDKYRRKGVEKQFVTSLEREDPEDEEPNPIDIPDNKYDPERMYEHSELQMKIQKALLKLPEKQRAVILLFDLEGMSYEEIAKVVDCPVGTVKSRLFNARLQLRKLLQPYLEAS
jgi:RNA polymerase sigma-70 factor (ECF subfamily)